MRIAGAAAALLVCQALLAQEVSYRVEVEAPRDIAAILRKGWPAALAGRSADDGGARAPPRGGGGEGGARSSRHRRLFLAAGRSAHRRSADAVAHQPHRRGRRAHARSGASLHRTGGAGRGSAGALQARARPLASAWRTVPSGRMGCGEARGRGRARELALRRGARRGQPRHHRSGQARGAARGRARQRSRVPLRRSARHGPQALCRRGGREPEPVRAGATYDRDLVLAYQRRLLETGYFASVQADIDTHPLLADAAPRACRDRSLDPACRGGRRTAPTAARARSCATQTRTCSTRRGASAARCAPTRSCSSCSSTSTRPQARRALEQRVRTRPPDRHPERNHARAGCRRVAQPLRRHLAHRIHRVGAPGGAARRRRPHRQPPRGVLRPPAHLPAHR